MRANHRNIAVLGTSSGVGKTLITVALCRWLRSKGISIAPFKAMSMHDSDVFYRAKPDGMVHYHQVCQAVSAKLSPEPEMNPVAIWVSAGEVQISVCGRRETDLLDRSADQRTASLREAILDSYHDLARRYEFIVVEGCGSPVELNLRHRDVSNMWLVNAIDAPAVLVSSITNTGVFAAFVGTLTLMPSDERRRVIGTLVNRYMGDPRDFDQGLRILEKRTGVACWGTVPEYSGAADLLRPPSDVTEYYNRLRTSHTEAQIDSWAHHVARHATLESILA